MTEPTPQRPAAPRRSRAWRWGSPVVVLLCGGLLAVSAADSDGTDLRPGRYTDLATLTQKEADDQARLQAEADALRGDVEALTRQIDDARVRRVRREAEALAPAAGLTEVSGPGLSILLSDAPREVLDQAFADPDRDLNQLVVHQQDLQAVVNALWDGGAQAVTIQGQRIISTTGIKCNVSAVLLQGVPYPAPYRVEAVGDPAAMQAALDLDPRVTAFREDAVDPSVSVGWDLEEVEDVVAPAYDGTVGVEAARPS